MKAASKEAYDLAVKSMTTLISMRLRSCVNTVYTAVPIVTGFGFLGHLCEMVTDQATARIYKEKSALYPGM